MFACVRMVYLERIDPPEEERGRRRRRRWTYLPPPSSSAAKFEGLELLNEIPTPLGLILWQRYRDVLVRTQAPTTNRRRLFDPRGLRLLVGDTEAEVPLALVDPIDALHRMVRGGAGDVVGACSAVASWAYEEGLLATAAAYARLAAVVDPSDPELAFTAGRATRDEGHYTLAEFWFQRTISLARRATDEEAKAAGYLGWGVLEEQRGRRRVARSRFQTALRTATGAGLARMAGLAHQYMMALTVPDGAYKEGLEHGIAAARYFADDDSKLIRLAIDIGAFASEHMHYGTALRLYEAALPFLGRPSDRLAGLANVGRAAAAIGEKRRFAEVWAEFDRLSLSPPKLFYAESLIELAHGAVTLRYWRHASKMIQEAVRVAREQDNPRSLSAARAVQQLIETKQTKDEDRPPDVALSRLADRVVERLRVLTARDGAAPN